MSLAIALRRFTPFPSFIQTGNGEPRKAHFLGKKDATPVEGKQDQGQKNDNAPKPTTGKYRQLSDITLGEVEEVYNHFSHQLIASPAEAWIAKNYFCQLPLKRKGDERPPVMFGRVKTCYPADGYVNNIEEMEMYFPRSDATPDVLHVRIDDVSLQKPTQSYCMGVKMYISETEMADFSRSENIFIEKGLAPIYETGYIDLLDVTEQNHSGLLWLNVIGSEWFASIPESMQPEIRQHLRSLVRWNTTIFNYHPKRYTLQYRSLNDELDFNYGFTEHFLIAPQDVKGTMDKVETTFGEMFMQGMEPLRR
jgi:hypothetical protein